MYLSKKTIGNSSDIDTIFFYSQPIGIKFSIFEMKKKKYGTLEFFCKKLLILNYALNVHVNAHNQIKIFWSIM